MNDDRPKRDHECFDPCAICIGRDLTEIQRMFHNLRAECVNRAGDPNIPGGQPMVLLGPGADIEAYGYFQLSAMMGRLNLGSGHQAEKALAAITRTEVEPPLSFLASWVDVIREARGQEPTQRKATINAEVTYLRKALDWMTAIDDDGSPWWIEVESFAEQLTKVRRALEAALYDGVRADRINARCNKCNERPRLCVRWGKAGIGDHWYCPACQFVFDADDVARCWRTTLVERGHAPEWVTVKTAASALGRSVKTIRGWTHDLDALGNPKKPRVSKRKNDDGPTEVNWPEARAADETTRRRAEYRALAL